ncbi:hypothetical protein ABK040_014736 [Willaertia magna]
MVGSIFANTTEEGMINLDGYRLIQYDKGTQNYGSRITGLNSPITTCEININGNSSTIEMKSAGLSAARSVVLLSLRKILENSDSTNPKVIFNTYFNNLLNRDDVSGLLIVIPKILENNQKIIESFKSIEKSLLLGKFEKPIYFIFENDDILPIVDIVNNQEEESNLLSYLKETYQVVTSEQEAKTIEPLSVVNLQTTLSGKESQNPYIGIVAHYDTISVLPGLSNGVNGDGSGAIGLLEIARLFQTMYASPSTRGPFNLLFVLTGGSKLGFSGTKHWINHVDSKLFSQLEFVLCLDTITSNQLYLHIAEKTNNKNIINLYKHLIQTSKQLGIDLQFIEKKVEREIAWEHELFAKKGIVSATLSSQLVPITSQLTKTSSLDLKVVNSDSLKKNILFIAEGIARNIYNISSISIFDEKSVNEKFIELWLKVFTNEPRFTPNMNKDNTIVKSLKSTLQQLGSDVKTQDFNLASSPYKFYGNSKVNLSIYQVKPISFDILLLFGVLAYLFILHISFTGISGVMHNISSLFKQQRTNKSKK